MSEPEAQEREGDRARLADAASDAKERFKQLAGHIHLNKLTGGIGFLLLTALVGAVLFFSRLPHYLAEHHINWWWASLAALVAYGQYVGFAISLQGACTTRLPRLRTTQLEVAESLTAMATPEAVGSLALSMRVLDRQGLKSVEAASAVGLSAFVTTASAALLVPIGGIFAAHYINVAKLKAEVPKSGWLVPAIIVAVAIGATILIKAPSARKRVEHSLLQAKAYLTTVAEHPQRALVIAGGEFFTVACQVACLSLLLLAVHAPVRISAVLVISQLAGAASNVVPVPGGLGAPEAILTAGLTAFGLPEIDALIVAISYRMCVYWLPPLPGTLLLFDLVRRRLV